MVFQGTKKTNKGHQARLQTLSFDLYMKNQGRGGGGGATDETMGNFRGGGRGATNETMDLCQGVVGSQQMPWLSTGGGGGGGGGYRRDHGSLSGAGGATEETMGLYQGWGDYRRDHGSLSGGGGLQTRPWVSIGGRGATGETMGLYKGEGGGAKQILWVSSRGWGAIRGGHHLHLFWWVLSLYSSFDQFPYVTFLLEPGSTFSGFS